MRTTFEGFKEHGIYFQNSPYSKVNHNHLIWFFETGGSKWAIYNDGFNGYAEVNYNVIELLQAVGNSDQWGIEFTTPKRLAIPSFDLHQWRLQWRTWHSANRSTIQDNYISKDQRVTAGSII